MKNNRIKILITLMSAALAGGVLSAGAQEAGETEDRMSEAENGRKVTITDMIGRQVEIVPGSYQHVVCIGAGALRMYSYIGDVSLLSGVEDIDNTALENRPQMFDGVARPYVIAYEDVFSKLPSCGVGGPNAQAAEAEKIIACDPDIVLSEYEDSEKEDALQEQLGVPVLTVRVGPKAVFDDAFASSMTMLGTVFGREDKAEMLLSFVESEKEDIMKRTADIAAGSRPGVYICGLGNWGTTNHLMTAQNYYPFTAANVRNVVADLDADGIQPVLCFVRLFLCRSQPFSGAYHQRKCL